MAFSPTEDLDIIKKVPWIPQHIKDEIEAGGWGDWAKYRIKFNGWTVTKPSVHADMYKAIGPHTVSVHKWDKSKGGPSIKKEPLEVSLTEQSKKLEWKFWIPGIDAGGIEWTTEGMVKDSEKGNPPTPDDPKETPADDEKDPKPPYTIDPTTVIADPKCKNPPLKPEDPPIVKGDVSTAVLAFQVWGVGFTEDEPNLPSVETHLDFHDGEDDPHGSMKWKLGTLDMITGGELMLWQGDHFAEILKASGHTAGSEEAKKWWEKEKSEIGYATWAVLNGKYMKSSPTPCGDIPAEAAEVDEKAPPTEPKDETPPPPSAPEEPKPTTLATHRMQMRLKYQPAGVEGPPRPHKKGRSVRPEPRKGSLALTHLPQEAYVLVEDEFLGPKKDHSRIKVVNEKGDGFTTAWLGDLVNDMPEGQRNGPF